MTYRYLFLLGRPGCGKSALYHELEKQILASGQAQTVERVDDFPKVWARMHGDDALEQEGKERIYTQRSADGAYLITDESFFDDILKEVSADVLAIDKPDHLIFLEFARPNYVAAIQNFDERILRRCLAIYMDVSFDICWARNVARHEAEMTQDGDDHFVYRETMEEIYLNDDRDAFVRDMKDRNIPVFVVNNEADGEEHLRELVQELFENLFLKVRQPAGTG
jgi:adenylate kinase family enzyme